MALGNQYQAKVKDASSVLVGVAQIRVGLPSVRAANYVSGTSTVKAAFQVPDSTVNSVPLVDGSGNVEIVVPGISTVTAPSSGTLASSGTYSGTYDGAFIVRYNGTSYDIYGPDGMKDNASVAGVTAGYVMKIGGSAGTTCGVSVTGTVSGVTSGMTWIIPVYTPSAIEAAQTGIICPYPLFQKDYNSVGGLKSSSFTPKVEETKTLSSGFPETEDDKCIVKTSVGISWESMEYTNGNLKSMKDMISAAINDSTTASVPVEMVCRTRGNSLITFWCPTCNADSFPEIAPTNDFSGFKWSVTANQPAILSTVMIGGVATARTIQHQTWQSLANVYTEFNWIH